MRTDHKDSAKDKQSEPRGANAKAGERLKKDEPSTTGARRWRIRHVWR